jgi:site-specific DNA-methyltransferase (cytosine-N4-specific)
MRQLLDTGKYTSGRRPSGHNVGQQTFLRDNGGAIPGNVLICSNTASVGAYLDYCRSFGLEPHPARMPTEIPEFFIRFLTAPRNLVLDPFAGSNTTGAAAERLKRRWVSVEARDDYIRGSYGRFYNNGHGSS